MARLKIAYIGGGGTRGPGTMASLFEQAENFAGSEVVLIDLDRTRLDLVLRLSKNIARAKGADITVSATTDRRQGLADCDVVLSSFRPGGFQARALDERIPLKYGIIGQETQGPGGFFMALRSINALLQITTDMEQVCPNACIFNYTNPVNIVAQALTRYTRFPTVSLCEGPIVFAQTCARAAGLDPAKLDVTMMGLNHACWSVRHRYAGEDMMPLLAEALERRNDGGRDLSMLKLAVAMGSIPATYFEYYYYHDECLAAARAKETTRSEDILAKEPDFWAHYAEQAEAYWPKLDPARSRGGIFELELALNVMDAFYNDRKKVLPVNVPNNGAIAGFANDLVVEVPAFIDASGIWPLAQGNLPPQVVGLVKMLGEFQSLAADAAWRGTRIDAIRALASNPLVMSFSKAEAIYDEMAAAHKAYLPKRLLS